MYLVVSGVEDGKGETYGRLQCRRGGGAVKSITLLAVIGTAFHLIAELIYGLLRFLPACNKEWLIANLDLVSRITTILSLVGATFLMVFFIALYVRQK